MVTGYKQCFRSWTLYRAFGGRSARLWTYFAKNYMWTVLNKDFYNKLWDFYFPRDFLKSGDFCPANWGFLFPGLRIFENLGILGIGFFFVVWDIPS